MFEHGNPETKASHTISSGRRQFLRNALEIGGAAALLLTASGRRTLAQSLRLTSEEMDQTRHARPANGEAAAAAPRGASAFNGCTDCSGGCSGTCASGCRGGCDGTCTGACAVGCTSSCGASCSGGCAGGCGGGCTGTCAGTSN